jgi:hypothetical protein
VTDFHVIYRLTRRVDHDEPEQWATYSYPIGIYTSGTNIAGVRSAFREAFEFAFPDGEADDYNVIEHLERPLIDGAFVRTAIDQRYLDRAETAQVFEQNLTDHAQRADFVRKAPMSGTGDAVVVTVVGRDKLGWLMDQMNDHDSLVLCLLAPGGMVWWSWVAGQLAELQTRGTSTLADDGLDRKSIVSDLITKDSAHTGRLVEIPA